VDEGNFSLFLQTEVSTRVPLCGARLSASLNKVHLRPLSRSQYQRLRAEFTDRGVSTMKDGYVVSDSGFHGRRLGRAAKDLDRAVVPDAGQLPSRKSDDSAAEQSPVPGARRFLHHVAAEGGPGGRDLVSGGRHCPRSGHDGSIY
jgi:hypothetical protein